MSSNPPTEPSTPEPSRPAPSRPEPSRPALLRRLRSPRTWSLRARLLVTLVALLAFVCAGVGVGSELALHRYMNHQLNDEVAKAARRSVFVFNRGLQPQTSPHPESDPTTGPGPAFLSSPGQATRTVGAVVSGGHVVSAGVITGYGNRAEVSATAANQLASIPTGHEVTVDLDGLGSYRLMATPAKNGQIIVAGLPTSLIDDTLFSAAIMYLAVAAVALLVATGAGIVLIRRQLAPLSRVSASAREVANLELERGEVSLPTPIVAVDPAGAHTEVGQLGAALNRMLETISEALSARQASETRVRQFVANASHELRTPLAVIRGYTEFAQRCGEELPTEVARALSRVESEAARMTQLVEDMLLLARLDEGRPLECEQVDLSLLVLDAVSDAHIAGPDHRWLLDIPDEPVVVPGDPARLHQVLANLLANSRMHTPPGTSVETSLAADPAGGVTMSVVDDGPGIPADRQPEIFERFARGDSARSRHNGSTGLGLAIVSAVVKAHHGNIEVNSVPGRTAFSVHLPGNTHS